MKNKSKTTGISLSMIVFLIFLVLKLTNNIDWSWWWVTAPLWIGPVLLLIAVILGFVLTFKYINKKR